MRHLMEPDPDAPPITLDRALWIIVLVLAIVVTVAGLSPAH